MATSIDFTPKKRKVRDIEFTLGPDRDGEIHTYRFTPPKQAAMMLPVIQDGGSDTAMIAAPIRWLEKGLSEDDMLRIYGRLSDEDDDLDFDFLHGVINRLIEEAGKRPTK